MVVDGKEATLWHAKAEKEAKAEKAARRVKAAVKESNKEEKSKWVL